MHFVEVEIILVEEVGNLVIFSMFGGGFAFLIHTEKSVISRIENGKSYIRVEPHYH
jgi:hypothetical protein